MFAAIQAEFAAALLDPDRPVPEAVTAHTARRPLRRFAVYRNNVVAGLVNALRDPIMYGRGLDAIWIDLLVLIGIFVVAMAFAIRFFRWDARGA